MGLILLIETATEICSVAVAKDGEIIALRETDQGNSHSGNVAVFIDEVIKESSISKNEINAVAISKGPGSYTGLRIGVSSAKGLCYGLNIPLISIDTLKSLSQGFINNQFVESEALLCPMIDARRMEVYSAIFNTKLEWVREIKADIVIESIYNEFLEKGKVYFFGNGAVKCRDILKVHQNASIIENILLSSENMAKLAEAKFILKEFENTAYFEPFYLKDFIAAKPVVKGLF